MCVFKISDVQKRFKIYDIQIQIIIKLGAANKVNAKIYIEIHRKYL